MFMIWAFDGIGNKRNAYRGEDCMKKFDESLRDHAIKIINFEKKKVILLTNKQQESHEKIKIYYIYKNEFVHKYTNDICKVRKHCHYTGKYRGAAHST